MAQLEVAEGKVFQANADDVPADQAAAAVALV
jgi:hypothetical protein